MLNNKGTIKLETERFILRKFKEHDAIDMYNNWASDSEVTKYLRWETHKSVEDSIEIINAWIKNYDRKEFYQWVIQSKENKDVIGSISLFNVDNHNENCELGYCIGKSFWNNGIVTEAVLTVIDFAFKEIKFKRISACHDANNQASGAVIKKCGFKYEGTLRNLSRNNKGKLVDYKYYSILIEEYLEKRKQTRQKEPNAKEENGDKSLGVKERSRNEGVKMQEGSKTVRNMDRFKRVGDFNVMVRNKLNDELGLFEKHEEILEKIRTKIIKYGTKTVLDIGCGTGNLCGELSQKLKVIGIDKSLDMISHTQKKYPSMTCRVGNFLDKPFRKNYVDIVVSTYAFHGLSENEKKKAIIYMLQYLKENGKIIIADFMFLNDAEKEKCKNRFYDENKEDLWKVIEEKSYTNIEKLKDYVKSLNCIINVENIVNFTWMIEIKR